MKKLAFHLQLEAACHSENCDNEKKTEHDYSFGLQMGKRKILSTPSKLLEERGKYFRRPFQKES